MSKRGELFLGGILVIIGVIALLGTLLRVSLGAFIWPLILIGLGAWFIMRPRMVADRREITMKLIGDIKRRGGWTVRDEEIWLVIGDVQLDLSAAVVPEGETTIRMYGFVSEARLIVPEDVAVSIRSVAFLSDAKVFGGRDESFIAPYQYASPGYDSARRRVRLETVHFVVDLDVRAA